MKTRSKSNNDTEINLHQLKTKSQFKKKTRKKFAENLEIISNQKNEMNVSKKKEFHSNETSTSYNLKDFFCERSEKYTIKISSWNVAGIRSWIKKDQLNFFKFEEPDILCLQEIKCEEQKLPQEAKNVAGYYSYWFCGPGGYAGVSIYSKTKPIKVDYGIGNSVYDKDGRIITAEYEKFFLVNVYVPNSGRKLVNLTLRMDWEHLFVNYVNHLKSIKPVIICGDMNVAHEEIDLANPKTNTRNAGFTQEERSKMSHLLSTGFVDSYRYIYPQKKDAYTFWTYMGNARKRNIGWRLDYFLLTKNLLTYLVDNCIRSQCFGSDHCPITLFLNI